MNEHISHRPETGSIQFGEDWRGVFIRGDNACWFGFELASLIESNPHLFDDLGIFSSKFNTLKDLSVLFNGADERQEDKNVQYLKSFNECLTEKINPNITTNEK